MVKIIDADADADAGPVAQLIDKTGGTFFDEKRWDKYFSDERKGGGETFSAVMKNGPYSHTFCVVP